MLRKWWVLRNEEGGDAGTGGGGGGGSDGAGAVGAGAASGEEKSILATLGAGGGQTDAAAGGAGGQGATPPAQETPEQAALKAAEKDTRRPPHVPAKFWNAEKGEVNFEAWAKSTKELEGRMKDIGLPPKSADEYQFEAPKAFKDAGLDLDPDIAKAFKEQALEAGLTQKQYEWVMSKYYDQVEQLVGHSAKVGSERLKTDLLSHYKTPEALQQNVALALSVVQAYGDEQEIAAALGPQGNTPAWVYRILAKVGKEMREDPGIAADGLLQDESVEELMKGKPGDEASAYWNPKHPQHAAVVAKVQKHFAAQEAARKRKRAA